MIENGTLPQLELLQLEMNAPKLDFALAPKRGYPSKCACDAFQTGRLVGTRVLLGYEVFPYLEHLQYFRKCIEPLVQQNARNGLPHHLTLRPLNKERTPRLLGQALQRCNNNSIRKRLVLYNSIAAGRKAVRPLEVLYG